MNELQNNGLIDSDDSVLDRRQKIFFALVEIGDEDIDNSKTEIKKLSKSSHIDDFLPKSKIRIPVNCTNIPEDWLTYTILAMAKYRIDFDNFRGCLAEELNESTKGIKIIDKDGKKLTIRQFVSEYERIHKLNEFLYKPQNLNFSSTVFGKMKYIGNVNNHNENLSIVKIDNLQGVVDEQSKAAQRTKAIQSIEDFFHDDPNLPYRPLPEHVLEASPCHSILEKKGKFYLCKLHSDIQNNYLESIEHHCKYKEPGYHKSEILKRSHQ